MWWHLLSTENYSISTIIMSSSAAIGMYLPISMIGRADNVIGPTCQTPAVISCARSDCDSLQAMKAAPKMQTYRATVDEASSSRFQNEERQPNGEDAHHVGDDECAAAVLASHVWETPEIAQSNDAGDGGDNVSSLGCPFWTSRLYRSRSRAASFSSRPCVDGAQSDLMRLSICG